MQEKTRAYRKLIIFGFAGLWASVAFANDPCVGVGTVTCSGDQSGGVSAPGGTTVINVNALTTNIQPAGFGIFISKTGSGGGSGVVGFDGGDGDPGGPVTANFDGSRNIIIGGNFASGIGSVSNGGSGGSGGFGATFPFPPFFVPAGDGGNGGNGGSATVNSSGTINTTGASFSHGIVAASRGGDGGSGGDKIGPGDAGAGGQAGAGGFVQVNSTSNITTTGGDSYGINARSLGGRGGNGGSGFIQVVGGGGGGGATGNGGNVEVTSSGVISTTGFRSYGVFAQSIGGFGGGGGDVWGTFGSAGDGNSGGDGGNVLVRLFGGSVTTTNTLATGVYAQSVGGGGGAGGFSVGLVGFGGNGSVGGVGRDVTVINGDDPGTGGVEGSAAIRVSGNGANGIFAQSIGGAGGDGGAAGGIVAVGGTAGAGGSSGVVRVINQGRVEMFGNGAGFGAGANAIFAQSVGGGGGAGGSTGGLVAIGGNGANGGNGNTVDVFNSGVITSLCGTGCVDAGGIYAQSVGGGGGKGGSTGGLVSVGAQGAAGGTGGNVTVNNFGSIETTAKLSRAIFAQSVGGGGGDGGNAGGWFSFGGAAGAGGNGGVVVVNNGANLTTRGDDSTALFAQSVGGGGGSGGSAVGVGLFISTAFGAKGGEGGDGQAVKVNELVNAGSPFSRIETFGERSTGVLAYSIGGGGGVGGAAVSASAGLFVNFGVAAGAGGGTGGNGAEVIAGHRGEIITRGDFSRGIDSQSVGGGGGSGGFAVQAGFALGPGVEGGIALGGAGGDGGEGKAVTVKSFSAINTSGVESQGIFAQSIGGGGGNGGLAIRGGVQVGGGGAQFGLALGGTGGGGGQSGRVEVNHTGNIDTDGAGSQGIFAQSIGGGGGTGGGSIVGGVQVAAGANANFAIGGDGGKGGNGGVVFVDDTGGYTHTVKDNSAGVVGQSVGAGGGNAGFAISGGVQVGTGVAVNFSLGGKAGSGGEGLQAEVRSRGGIRTSGGNSAGLIAQSVGGGGGNGGFAISGNFSTGGGGIAVGFGGEGGAGGRSNAVIVKSFDTIETFGGNSAGIMAQSVGGGGGNGGFTVNGSIGLGIGNVAFGKGGGGGLGGIGGSVNVDARNIINTRGDNSAGIFAQSVGGGGGNGGFAISAAGGTGIAAGLAFGGSGGGGSIASNVDVRQEGSVRTIGDLSQGVFAQSVGGGGGNGGFAISAAVTIGGNFSGGFAFGGGGGGGANAGEVRVTNIGSVTTGAGTFSQFSISPLGAGSNGIQAQSIGGGGGNGGFAVSASGGTGYAIGVTMGGKGGGGGDGKLASVTNSGDVRTFGDNANGIFAQSIGGGGGNGAFAITGALSIDKSAGGLSFGGKGGAAGNAGTVEVTSFGDITTGDDFGRTFLGAARSGSNSNAILAQSIGGGGGNGGFAGSLVLAKADAISIALGGEGSGGGNGGIVKVNNIFGNLSTELSSSAGISAQSIGGGGGNAGFAINVNGSLDGNAGRDIGGKASGGSGGRGGFGQLVEVKNFGNITTRGDLSNGISAQSIGGGGGNGGFAVSASVSLQSEGYASAVGGVGGLGSNGGQVDVFNTRFGSTIRTLGQGSIGIFAQSVGGGGGNGGFAGAVSFSLNAKAKNTVGGGAGGVGGTGGNVAVTNNAAIITGGANASGIQSQSIGGGGGNGGFAIAAGFGDKEVESQAIGGSGAVGSSAGNAKINNSGSVVTGGALSHGLFAQSVGGGGGSGGFAVAGSVSLSSSAKTNSVGGQGGAGSDANLAEIINIATIRTGGDGSNAIFAQSVGGGGGSGGFAAGVTLGINGDATNSVGGGAGGAGGIGRRAYVDNASSAAIETAGNNAVGILAQSIGGGGGNGGLSLSSAVSLEGKSIGNSVGGNGGAGGNSENGALVFNRGDIVTNGNLSHGIHVQSVGGGGGNGGFAFEGSVSLKGNSISSAVGGGGAAGGNASGVTLENFGNVTIGSASSRRAATMGLIAQSIGGGGGNGAFSLSGNFALEGDTTSSSIGGKGSGGGSAEFVNVRNGGEIRTFGEGGTAVLAQSIGGGGGNGGFALGAGATLEGKNVSSAVGGSGGQGGAGRNVEVAMFGTSLIRTDGLFANGIQAQSIGGGGGNGGFAIGAGFSLKGNVGSTLGGGAGGGGGEAGTVTVNNAGVIVTGQASSIGIMAQSIGGGGGNGGFAIGAGGSLDGKANNTIGGGAGGAASRGQKVFVGNTGEILTQAANSSGVLAQSIGGGGGNGGFAIGAGFSLSGNVASNALGGTGGTGGIGGEVEVQNSKLIQTNGNSSTGITAQSIGGGGGNGGFAIGADFSLQGDVASKLGGGAGGGGGRASIVTVRNSGLIETGQAASTGILAQSIGGGGGSGGFAIGAGGTLDGKANNTIGGGSGGGASRGEKVLVENTGEIITLAANSNGVLAQSIGGGGGAGGFAIGAGFSGGDAGSNALGGTGGAGGAGGEVEVQNSKLIRTEGASSTGITAQSIGGGGGSGGFAIGAGGSLNGKVDNKVGGGSGGAASSAAKVFVNNSGEIFTAQANSTGILAQSIGGGGGDGGFSIGAGLASGNATTNAIGGLGGSGGAGGLVQVDNSGQIVTDAARSTAIIAQSIGGGGGNGGFVIGGALTSGDSVTNSVGGAGGTGGKGGVVIVNHTGIIEVRGEGSVGIVAQSIGGGGGNGGFVGSLSLSGGAGANSTVGGLGGDGGDGGDVTVNAKGTIRTFDANSVSIIAQSIAGGGGNGGFNLGIDSNSASSLDLTVGAQSDGKSGAQGKVTINISEGAIQTGGALAHGMLAQAVGGGGGNSGFAAGGGSGPAAFAAPLMALAASVPSIDIGAGGVSLKLGATGSASGKGVTLDAMNSNSIFTEGAGAAGAIGQSIGGGGGVNSLFAGLNMSGGALGMRVGGTTSGASQAGGDVLDANTAKLVHQATLATTGSASVGALLQSIGGGGGLANIIAPQMGGAASGIDFSVGGGAGKSAIGTSSELTLTDQVLTDGALSHAAVAQSIGGGGGVGSFAAEGGVVATGGVQLRLGGVAGGAGGDGGLASLAMSGATVITNGAIANALAAQSIGGGGGILSFLNGGVDQQATNLILGASSGTGAGGEARMVNNAQMVVSGASSVGLISQSIGGGGGAMQTIGLAINSATLSLGAGGGAGGNGGNAFLENTGGIFTTNNGGHGLLAQSVGGGGGLFMASDISGLLQNPLVQANAGGAGGDGGLVDLTNSADILTLGNQATGILAQSVAGGGGIVGGGIFSNVLNQAGPFAGSAGGAGNAGDVSVVSLNAVRVRGSDSIGVYAQSAAGTGTGGAVDMDLFQNIVAANANSIGVQGESSGAAGDNVNIRSRGFVEGGNGTGSAFSLISGGANLIDTSGEVIALSDLAVNGTIGNDRVRNRNKMIGNVRLASGLNSVQNDAFAYFLTYSDVFLTDPAVVPAGGNTLNNDGTFNLNDNDELQLTTLRGNFTQALSGIMPLDVDLNTQTTDRMLTSGSAAINGTAPLLLMSIDKKFDEYSIIPTQLGAVDNGFTPLLRSPAVGLKPKVKIVGGTDVVLYADKPLFADMAAAGGVTDPNVLSLANGLSAAEALVTVDDPFNRLINLLRLQADEQRLKRALYSLTPSDKTHVLSMAGRRGTLFMDHVDNCNNGQAYRGAGTPTCVWARYTDGGYSQKAIDGRPRFADEDYGFMAGGLAQIDPKWQVGFGLDRYIAESRASRPDTPDISSDAELFQAAALANYNDGRFNASFVLGFGTGSADSQRLVTIDGYNQIFDTFEGIGDEALVFGQDSIFHEGINGVAKSTARVRTFNSRAEFGYRHDLQQGSWVRPYMTFDYQAVQMRKHSDSGVGLANLTYPTVTNLVFTATPSLEIGHEVALASNLNLKVVGRAGVALTSHEYWKAKARFSSGPGNAPSFELTEPVDQVMGKVQLGMQLSNNNGFGVEASYGGLFGKSAEEHSFRAAVKLEF